MELNECFEQLEYYENLDENELVFLFKEIFANLAWPKSDYEIFKIENNFDLSEQKIRDLFDDLKEQEKQYYKDKSDLDTNLFEEYKIICGNKLLLFFNAIKYLRKIENYRDGHFERQLTDYLMKLF